MDLEIVLKHIPDRDGGISIGAYNGNKLFLHCPPDFYTEERYTHMDMQLKIKYRISVYEYIVYCLSHEPFHKCVEEAEGVEVSTKLDDTKISVLELEEYLLEDLIWIDKNERRSN